MPLYMDGRKWEKLTQRASKSGERIPAIDGLRGLAILLVLVWHYANPDGAPVPAWLLPFRSILHFAWTGVGLFFVISGFLLGGILLEHRASPRFFTTFYARRAARILPLYLLWVFLGQAALHSGAIASLPWLSVSISDQYPPWTSLTFTQNLYVLFHANAASGGAWLSSTWSLAIEEQFYLVLPLLLRFCPIERLPSVLLVLIAAAPITRVLMDHPSASLLFPLCRMDALFMGVLLAVLFREKRFREKVARLRTSLAAALLFLSAGIVWMDVAEHRFGSALVSHFGLTWFALFYGCLLLFLLSGPAGAPSSFFRFVFQSRILVGLGKISYGVFLFHLGVSGLVGGYFAGRQLSYADWWEARTALLLLGSMALTILLAALAHWWVEKPMHRFGHRWKY